VFGFLTIKARLIDFGVGCKTTLSSLFFEFYYFADGSANWTVEAHYTMSFPAIKV
jgi:hypothetical protein